MIFASSGKLNCDKKLTEYGT